MLHEQLRCPVSDERGAGSTSDSSCGGGSERDVADEGGLGLRRFPRLGEWLDCSAAVIVRHWASAVAITRHWALHRSAPQCGCFLPRRKDGDPGFSTASTPYCPCLPAGSSGTASSITAMGGSRCMPHSTTSRLTRRRRSIRSCATTPTSSFTSPRPILRGSIRSKSGLPRSSGTSSHGACSPPRPTCAERSCGTSAVTTATPGPSAGPTPIRLENSNPLPFLHDRATS
jgi:hypothetical protein